MFNVQLYKFRYKMQVTQQTRAPCQCALRRTIRPLQASCSAGVARSLVIRAVAHDEQRPVRAEGAHPAEPEQICSPSPIAACAPALTLLPLLATPLAHAGGFPSIADLFSLDGVTAVLFATVFAALLTVTLGVSTTPPAFAYLSLASSYLLLPACIGLVR